MFNFKLKRGEKGSNHKKRSIINILAVATIGITIYALGNFTVLGQENILKNTLRRSLAQKAEVIYSRYFEEETDPNRYKDARFFIVRYGDEIGVGTLRKGKTTRVTTLPDVVSDGIQELLVENEIGIAPIAEKYGATFTANKIDFAVICLNDKVDRVEVVYKCQLVGDEQRAQAIEYLTVPMENAGNGVFIGCATHEREFAVWGYGNIGKQTEESLQNFSVKAFDKEGILISERMGRDEN